MTSWKRVNRLLYLARCAFVYRWAARAIGAARLGREVAALGASLAGTRTPAGVASTPTRLPTTAPAAVSPAPAIAVGASPQGDRERTLLYLSCGRIGDAVLARPFLALLRERTGATILVAGRGETRTVLEDLAQEFVAVDLAAFASSAEYRAPLLRRLCESAPFAAVVADTYAFHGGLDVLGGLVDALPAARKLVYEGYAPAPDLAPIRRWPRTAQVVPSLAKGDPGVFDADRMHVLRDHAHYLRAVLAALGCDADVRPEHLRPELPRPSSTVVLEALGLAAGDYIVCQPFSASRKRDWPLVRWRELWASFPAERFVLLGGAREARRSVATRTGGDGADAGAACPNVIDLCGKTSLTDAAAVIGAAKAFVGLDSGLTHVAAAIGAPTVCVAQNSNLGYFVPYPSWLGYEHLRVVHNREYETCAGCLMVCSREPITRTFRRGALCLRTLPAAPVAAALDATLRAGTLRAGTLHAGTLRAETLHAETLRTAAPGAGASEAFTTLGLPARCPP